MLLIMLIFSSLQYDVLNVNEMMFAGLIVNPNIDTHTLKPDLYKSFHLPWGIKERNQNDGLMMMMMRMMMIMVMMARMLLL